MIEHSKWAQQHYDNIKRDPYFIAVELGLNLSDYIWHRMEKRKITITELARRTGHTRNTISRWLHGIWLVKFADVVHLLIVIEREER